MHKLFQLSLHHWKIRVQGSVGKTFESGALCPVSSKGVLVLPALDHYQVTLASIFKNAKFAESELQF